MSFLSELELEVELELEQEEVALRVSFLVIFLGHIIFWVLRHAATTILLHFFLFFYTFAEVFVWVVEELTLPTILLLFALSVKGLEGFQVV